MANSLSVTVHRNRYVDSVTLLQVTAEVLALEGVVDAALVMATELNRDLLRDMGLLVDKAEAAGVNDLVIAVRAGNDATGTGALQTAEALLAHRRPGGGTSTRRLPRSLRSAHRADPDARLAVISVPGPYAAAEARQALTDGLHVFLFSDNVALEDEVDLKQRAREKGLLVMGPDCGTAILNGVGLGFANVVRRGSVGLVGASGTGIQEVVSLIHQAGGGISHAIGTGSRDLAAEVGGITTLQALDLLRDDPSTETIVLVSKPPAPAVAEQVLAALVATGKRAVAYLQGVDVQVPNSIMVARDLEDAACLALSTDRSPERLDERPHESHGRTVGLFCGGTLCQEAKAAIGESDGHVFIDFGDDEYTRGRAHPMIDPTLRNQAIVGAGADPLVRVILLDFILGLGAHPDPAGATVPAIGQALVAARREGRELSILAHVVGTDRDPQGLASQQATLRAAGVQVFGSNVRAARAASAVS